MVRFDFSVDTVSLPATPAILSTATKLEIAATVLCGLAALVWVAAALSAIGFRNQAALDESAVVSRMTYAELRRVVVVGERKATGQTDQGLIRMARIDGSAQQPSSAN